MTTDGNIIAPADPKLGKPKAPPPPTLTRLAGDAQVESIDGPLEIGGMVGKFLPVLTRVGDGSLGFRMMREVRQVEPAGRILRIVNAEGQSVRVGVGHVFVRADGKDVRAGDLVAGDRLEAGWTYPPGYVLPEADEYAAPARGRSWEPVIVVAAIESSGEEPLFGFTVNETRNYFLTFGARSRAQR